MISAHSSPNSTHIRFSDIEGSDFRPSNPLEFLGFNLDAFVDSVGGAHANCTSDSFPNPTEEQLHELRQHCEDRDYKILIKSDVSGSFLVFPLDTHESINHGISHMITSNNERRTGDMTEPIKVLGTGDTTVNGTTVQPDLKVRVDHRHHNSPNMMVETHYRSRKTDVEFHARLVSFITGTDDVMLSVGFSIFDLDDDGYFQAVVMVYERSAANQPNIVVNVSFGTGEITAENAAAWNEGAQAALNTAAPGSVVPPMVGYGTGGPPCTQATGTTPLYLITFSQALLLCTNTNAANLQFHHGLGPALNLDFTLNLWQVQKLIQSSYTG